MHNTRKILRLMSRSANWLQNQKFYLKKKTGLLRPPRILPFRGFGNLNEMHIRGRVVEDKGLSKPDQSDGVWANMKAMYKRYTSNEIPYCTLKVNFFDQEKIVNANEEGYFRADFTWKGLPEHQNEWFQVQISLEDDEYKKFGDIKAAGEAMVPLSGSQYGVISDVDDTILVSKATTLYRKLRLMLMKNAHTRLPFEGVSAFYRALQRGDCQTCYNPIIFVSSSSWKLYDLLVDFCRVKGIPKAPFMLRQSRLDEFKFISDIHKNHKMIQIQRIMETFSDLQFVLIGDSGQKDAEIYKCVVEDYPGRVKQIYIRDVVGPKRHEYIKGISTELKEKHGVDMCLVKNTVEAAEDAAAKGLISREDLPAIRGEKEMEEGQPSDLQKIMSSEETVA
ncbi:App1 family protein [Roseivirga sp. BDSF3-8]|uniref:App1 family protein n=1 Tax=Roseivirga sp. BDSF3-8 TaxID=3241598 RepID=UPI003531EB8E